MVLQQCLACNTLMTESCTSCVCGHVFEFSKQIGGKRFSEYRAELYSRLENKRIKRIERERQKAGNNRQTPKENKTNTTEKRGVVRPSFKPRPHASDLKTASRGMKSKLKRFSRPPHPSHNRTALPPELVSRFPSALQEINRRLMGQNMIWWTMHCLE